MARTITVILTRPQADALLGAADLRETEYEDAEYNGSLGVKGAAERLALNNAVGVIVHELNVGR